MFLFLKRQWRKRRQVTNEIQARDAEELIPEREKRDNQQAQARETEEQIQREKRNTQQAQTLHLIQDVLRRNMDPLISAQVYNHRFCPLSRLPEELLLCIVDFLCDDIVTLHCLRIVSRVFLRLLHDQSAVWKWQWYNTGRFGFIDCPATYPHDILKLQFQQLLQRDGRCDNCRRWHDTHEGCSWDVQIPLKDWHSSPSQRQDLGQQGTVQLCDHIQITWASIQTHIDNWQQQHRGGDWQACFDSFNVECHDISHDTRCTASEAPTWPRAFLDYGDTYDRSVVLYLEWSPHCRIDTLALTTDGRIPAPELRALFQRLRDIGPVGNLCPPSRPGVLPEMACFSPLNHLGPFVYYKTGEDDKLESLSPPFPPLLSVPWQMSWGKFRIRSNGKLLDIRPHYLLGTGGTGISSQCLKISYMKDILIFRMRDLPDPTDRLIPTADWIAAMDAQTYPHPPQDVRPQCRDAGCTNYYRRSKNFHLCFDVSSDYYVSRRSRRV
jgi:hypothetical protein